MTTASFTGASSNYKAGEVYYPTDAYRCHVCLIREPDGTLSVIVLNLPGIGSSGESEQEALDNVREAISGAIAEYKKNGEDIPWETEYKDQIPEGANCKWILVNV